MTKYFRTLIVTAGLLGLVSCDSGETSNSGDTASAQECGRVTLANMNWQSAEVVAHIDAVILSEGYGCDVELVPGDTMPTFTSMIEKSEPDMASELWVNSLKIPLDKAVAEGSLMIAAKVLIDGGVEGWWIPKYLADAHPEIKTIEDALARPDLFPAPEDSSKGAVYNCPSGWNCQILTENLFKGFKAGEKGFVLVDTGSAAGLDGSIAKAYERGEGWLGYYWAPTSILGKYEMVKLDEGVEHDAEEWVTCTGVLDCEDPKPNAWLNSAAYTVVTKHFAETAAVAMGYIKTRQWDNATVNALLSWMSDNQATGAEASDYFLKNSPEVWTPWVSSEAAEKIKIHLEM
jgi:glycine betaine/proline transport system substrate-binding protein